VQVLLSTMLLDAIEAALEKTEKALGRAHVNIILGIFLGATVHRLVSSEFAPLPGRVRFQGQHPQYERLSAWRRSAGRRQRQATGLPAT
jgi:hypothetical protein